VSITIIITKPLAAVAEVEALKMPEQIMLTYSVAQELYLAKLLGN
jgi:hypothetical protein